MSDTDATRAAAIVARILRNPPSADVEVTARHIVTALKGHGWRPTAALPLPPWAPRPSLPVDRNRTLAAQAREGITKEEDHG